MSANSDRVSRLIFILSAVGLLLGYGAASAIYGWFPGAQIGKALKVAERTYKDLTRPQPEVNIPGDGPRFQVYDAGRMQPGATLVVSVGEDLLNTARIHAPDGSVLHQWRTDWFEIWPDGSGFPKGRQPKRQPGTTMHGVRVLPDASLVFNFEHLSTVRVDACSTVMWKHANLGHHFVNIDNDGDIWVGAETFHSQAFRTRHPNFGGRLNEDTYQQIAPDGTIRRTLSVLDLLLENDLMGLAFMGTLANKSTRVVGDITHLNDVDFFPADMEPGYFKPGDMIVSMRNINTVVVVDPETMELKHRATGMFLRQHDPDFTSGNSYVVFDNRNMETGEEPQRSRVLEMTVTDQGDLASYRELYRGEGDAAYFTNVMGSQQILPNGNALVISSFEGRVLELTPAGDLVWEHRNAIGDGKRGVVTEAERLPPAMDAAFFEEKRAACG
ncbi:MAG: arylsulfotransferase family protein [Pseudomonadota bacterium]